MRKFDLSFEGTLTTLSPLTIVLPGAEEVLGPEGQKRKRVAMRTVFRDGIRENVPVVTGSTLRGRLRRSAVEAVLSLGGQKIPLAEWHQNAVGGIKGAEKEDAHDVMFRNTIRQKNPVLALFGAGAPWMVSRVSVSDAIPDRLVAPEVISSVRSDDGRRNDGFFEKLDASAFDEWAALADANRKRTEYKASQKRLRADLRKAKAAGDPDEARSAQKALDDLEDKAKAAELLVANPVSMPLAHEAIPTGVNMIHSMTLQKVTQEEIGLFIAALNLTWKRTPQFGQHGNLGYGRLSGEYDIYIEDAESFDPFSVGGPERQHTGTLVLTPDRGCETMPAELSEAMTAFRTAFEAGKYDLRVAALLRET